MTRTLFTILALAAVSGCGPQPGPPPAAAPTAATAHPPTEPAGGPGWFEDRTPGSGIDFTHRTGEEHDHYTILESLGGGVALVDYDGDGLLDVFLTGGGDFEGTNPPAVRGLPNRLYKNLGGWTFRDVTAECGLDSPVFYSHGAAVGDYDRDGWPDLLVTGYRRVALYANRPAGEAPDRREFRDVTRAAGVPEELPWSTSAAFGDLDGDGFPELFVCQYLDWSFAEHRTCPHHAVRKDVCTPHAFRPLRPFLFRNTGDGRFEDVSGRVNLRADGKGLGVVIADLDGDRRPDVYVANDASDNHLYLNRGGLSFEECGLARGAAVDEAGHPNGSMGIAVADWDRSGWPSLVVTNFQGEFHALYQNTGGGRFAYASQTSGLARLGQAYVGFGAGLADFDHDGWADLAVANGHVLRHPVGSPLAQQPVLMRNAAQGGRRRLVNVTPDGGPYFRTPHRGRGLAVGDLDNDGWVDLVVSHQNETAVLLRNRAAGTARAGSHWAGFSLRSSGNRSIVGAKVSATSGGQTQTGYLTAGGYLSHGDSRLYFGLGTDRQVDRVTVDWPFGASQTYDGPLAADRLWLLDEAERAPKPDPTPRGTFGWLFPGASGIVDSHQTGS